MRNSLTLLIVLPCVAFFSGCGGSSSGSGGGEGTSTRLLITTTSLPTAQINALYNASLQATGGDPPFTWSVTSGTLPAGLALNASSGAITGTPTQAVSNV